MRAWGRRTIAVAAVGFWYLCYLYLTLPDVRPLVAGNPTTTAFIARRVAEAREAGRDLKPQQRWVAYARISPQLKRAAFWMPENAFDPPFWVNDT